MFEFCNREKVVKKIVSEEFYCHRQKTQNKTFGLFFHLESIHSVVHYLALSCHFVCLELFDLLL